MAPRNTKDGKSAPSAKATAKKSKAPARSDDGAAARVAALRAKLTSAMEDPLMRDQIVRAIRTVMRGE